MRRQRRDLIRGSIVVSAEAN